MREIIEKLYYGNIKPTEKPIKEESGYQELVRLAALSDGKSNLRPFA